MRTNDMVGTTAGEHELAPGWPKAVACMEAEAFDSLDQIPYSCLQPQSRQRV